MNVQSVPIIDDAGWDVPGHEIALYGEKRHRYALVIPVINEGERIRGQLLRTQAADLPVDVIVADGGSTDGSLDADFVSAAGVRAVLTKTGPGKLSAQLRMAYAWCLKQGYAGIVTIDGNGKDGVEAVAEFVAKLDEGCDYVQGSRYLPGGEAENTPLERTIANRLIHAPLLSLSGRHFFMDTTNGFRAYSARYLLHPEVKPFREEFQVYGLLFYLTVRAGQLGMKVDQVPVVRRYPDSGKVPTKIGGLASKLALLGETVFAATGGNTPDNAAPRQRSLFWALLVALLVTLPLFLTTFSAPTYSPDSWALYELSQTVFSDFYRFTHFRSYASDAAYSSAFPPLYPTLIAITDTVFGTGARTGLYLAFLAYLAFAVLSERIGRAVTGAPWVGLAAALVLLLGPKMLIDELEAGRTIPLQMCCFALVLLGLLKAKDMALRHAVFIGVMAGLAVLNRFDAAPLPILAALAIGWLTRKPLLGLVALGASVVAISPWIVYSLTTFGVVFATDNSGIIGALDPRAFVTDWWPQAQPTMADDPAAWAARLGSNVLGFVSSGASLIFSPLGFAMAGSLLALGAIQYVSAKRPQVGAGEQGNTMALGLLALFAVIVTAMMGPQVLTGYLEYRYFSALFWIGFLLAGCWLIARGTTAAQRMVFGRLFLLAVLVTGLPFYALGIAHSGDRIDDLSAGEDIAALKACVGREPSPRILVLGDNLFAAKAGALAGVATMMEPRNMTEGRLDPDGSRAFLEAWDVDYVLVKDPARARFASETFDLGPSSPCLSNLYPVSR